MTNQTPTSGQFSQGRATREYRDYNQQHLINAAMLAGTHEMSRSTIDWNIGASRGERETPFRVDWEFRSAANAFPNRYDVSDPELVRVTPSENFYSGAAYPFRRVRYREDIEREDVLTGELNVKRATTFGTRPGYWKAGGKVVTRDKSQIAPTKTTTPVHPRSRWPTSGWAASVRMTSFRTTSASVQRSIWRGSRSSSGRTRHASYSTR